MTADAEVNALANFCFLTKDTNLVISDQLPEDYFPKIEEAHPGALASQWIPDDDDRLREAMHDRRQDGEPQLESDETFFDDGETPQDRREAGR